MAVPLIVPAVAIGARVLSSVKNAGVLSNSVGVGLGTVAAYLGYSDLDLDFLNNAPSGNNTVPITKPTVAPPAPVSSPDVKNPSAPAPSVPFMEAAKQVNASSGEKAKTASVPLVASSTGGLLDILKKAGENSFQIEAAKTQIIAEQLGFLNEQFGASLLYQDMLVNSLFELASAVSALASAKTLEVEKDSNAMALAQLSEMLGAKEMGANPEALAGIASAVASASPKAELKDISKTLKPVAENSEKSLERQRFMTTPQAIKDLEGNVITRATPDQIRVAEAATTAKYRTDVNNEEFDDIDLPSWDTLPILPFVGVNSVFDVNTPITENPFITKYL